MTAKTKKEFDDQLTKMVMASELEPREFIEVFLFAVARVIYCANQANGAVPLTPDAYITPLLGQCVSDVLLTNLKFIESLQQQGRIGATLN